MNPTWGLDGFHNKVVNDLNMGVSRSLAYRPKVKALQAINGNHEEYKLLWDYAVEIRRVMSSSIVILKRADP